MSNSENKRSSMVQPLAWWDSVDAAAAEAEENRAEYLYRLHVEKLTKREAAIIPERPKNGRPFGESRK